MYYTKFLTKTLEFSRIKIHLVKALSSKGGILVSARIYLSQFLMISLYLGLDGIPIKF